jgi:hypothetical protein
VKPRAALIRANIEIVQALVEALIEPGSLSGEQIDSIISREFEIMQTFLLILLNLTVSVPT